MGNLNTQKDQYVSSLSQILTLPEDHIYQKYYLKKERMELREKFENKR